MGICLKEIIIENFKSYEDMQKIDIANLGVFMGANSSGKSTALQALLTIKQTMECNSPDVNLLLSGKYVTLGDFDDVINQAKKNEFKIGIAVTDEGENYGKENKTEIIWTFQKDNTMKSKLINLDFNIENENIRFLLDKGDIYRIFVNSIDTQLSVKLINLTFSKFFINYNSEFNVLFQSFINELIKNISFEKKISKVENTKIVSHNGVNRLYHYIIQNSKSININVDTTKKILKDTEHTANMIMSLIDEYCEFQSKYFGNYSQFPYELRQNLLFVAILQKGSTEHIKRIYEKYKKKLGEFKKRDIMACDVCDILSRSFIYSFKSGDKGTDSAKDIIVESFIIYREIIKNIIAKIFYVGPIREQPQGLYNIDFETIPKYVGKSGAYFASVLLHENRIKQYILPNDCIDEMDLLEAVDEWAVHLNIASEIKVEQRNSFGFSVSIANTQQKKSDIMNVGIGTSQVLPVLITGLLSEEGEVLIFEQPELHLHPFSQSRLADFFVALVKRGRQIIVETHSEYFILRLRYNILTNNINEKQITINFFQNKNGTRISKGILSGYGSLQYPDDFCDETQELVTDLMNASLMKKKEEINEKYID